MQIVIAVLILLIAILTLKYVLPSSRKRLLNLIIADLESYEAAAPQDEKYGVEQNIRFFKAAKHLPNFIFWQVFLASKIDADRLLEIADLDLPKWEKQLYRDLGRLERKRFPGLLKPLAKTLADADAVTYLDVGCGSMEAERQAINLLSRRHVHRPRIFIGLDMSLAAYDMIQKTFSDYKDKVQVAKVDSISPAVIQKYTKKSGRHAILFIQQDAVELSGNENRQKIDVVFSSKFKHHLRQKDKGHFDRAIEKLGEQVFEFDDYRTATSWIPPMFTAWKKPILLNGALLSRLRQPAKKDLQQKNVKFFSPPGSYVRFLKVVEKR